MAVEQKRGCGYRKVGGLYLVSDGAGQHCHRLPINLHVCPVCSAGIKHSRGVTWINPLKLFGQCEKPLEFVNECSCDSNCFVCNPADEKHILMWIGAGFYKTPADFTMEAAQHGISRRIAAVPRGFELGKTIVYLAHIKAGIEKIAVDGVKKLVEGKWIDDTEEKEVPAVFYAFRPTRIEKIITESESKDHDIMETLERQGVTAVVVPDDDKDHRGSVHDKEM